MVMPCFHTDKRQGTSGFSDNRVGVRVPLCNDCAGCDRVAFVATDNRTVRQFVALALATEVVGNSQLAGTRYRHQRTISTRQRASGCSRRMVPPFFTWILIHCGSTAGRTTDVERTHGQLCTRLTDRLGSDHTDCLAYVDLMTTRQVTAVAVGTDAMAGFTGDRRTHYHFVDTVRLQRSSTHCFVDQGAARNEYVVLPGLGTSCAITRPSTRSPSGSTTSPPSMCGVISRPSSVPQSISVTTRSWRHVNQTTGQVTGVRGFQAVSARPLRAPWVEMKYCSTFRPSRKFAVIGVSIMEPSGLAIRPRIPAS